MRVRNPNSAFPNSNRPFHRVLLLSYLTTAFYAAAPSQVSAQETSQSQQEEIVVNLSAGCVVIAVVKDAILIGTIENPIEADTRIPTPVALSGKRAGVILGAVQWVALPSHAELARLDKDLPHLRGRMASTTPRLQQGQGGGEAGDIEAIGQGVLERLNDVAKDLHSKINLPEEEPVVELILAGYLQGYGPEVWQLAFPLEQVQQRGDFWDSRVLRPRYLQFWPPEKGRPRTLVEFRYPPSDSSPSLLELLRQKDPRLEKICASDPKMRETADHFLAGESGKILAADATQFLRAAFAVIVPPNARQTVAVINDETGFDWILAPPPEPKKPGEQKQRPPGAPTLAKPPSSN
ncbi:MAG: hypothetical protein WBP79_10465 [Candidatus Acidiferrales bacterium]